MEEEEKPGKQKTEGGGEGGMVKEEGEGEGMNF